MAKREAKEVVLCGSFCVDLDVGDLVGDKNDIFLSQ